MTLCLVAEVTSQNLCGGGRNRRCCKGKFLLKQLKQQHFKLFCSSHEKSNFLDGILPMLQREILSYA